MLKEICYSFTKADNVSLTEDKTIGSRMICSEYSMNIEERKLFPNNLDSDIFLLCWISKNNGIFYSFMLPSNPILMYSKKFIDGEKTQLHTHDYIELGYVVEGVFKQKIFGKDIIFKAGELFLIDKNCIHQDYLLNQDSTVIFIGMSNELFDEMMVGKLGEEKIADFLKTSLLKQKDTLQYLHFTTKGMDNSKLEKNLIMLIKELENNDEASRYIIKGIIMRILNLISLEYSFLLSIEQKKKMTSFIIEEIKQHIHDNYSNISIKDLVNKFHFNEDYFNRILKKNEGMTYSEYVKNIRLKKSIELLLNTERSIEDIAREVGYNNKGYFYKIFLSKYGITPATYRKVMLKNK